MMMFVNSIASAMTFVVALWSVVASFTVRATAPRTRVSIADGRWYIDGEVMLEKLNQRFPFTFQAADDPVVYAALKGLAGPAAELRAATPEEVLAGLRKFFLKT